MLKTLFLFLSVANTFISTLCSDTNAENALNKIWKGNAEFSQNFLYLKINENPGKSFIASPLSVLLPLAQLALYATGITQNQFTNVLNVKGTTAIREGFRRLLDNFKSPKNVELSLAQRVYSNVYYDLDNIFKSDTKKYFDAEAQSLDFDKNQEAAVTINDWVEQQTNGLVSKLIDAPMLNRFTQMVLVNAIYFKGSWKYPFEPRDTEKKIFHLSPTSKMTIRMMRKENFFKYTKNTQLQIKALQLQYKDPDYSFLSILPTSKDDYNLKGVAQKIKNPRVFNRIIDDLRYGKIDVSLPPLETSTTTNLKEILQGVNITEVFNPNNFELSGILKEHLPIHISVAIQKAKVVIDELGSEASASTDTIIQPLVPTPMLYETFNANRPFLYFILYNRNVLFCGAYLGN